MGGLFIDTVECGIKTICRKQLSKTIFIGVVGGFNIWGLLTSFLIEAIIITVIILFPIAFLIGIGTKIVGMPREKIL